MHIIDILIFVIYMVIMLGVGFFFLRKNKDPDDYYVGGRAMGSWSIGLSVVATDVGGGFSIGLGGLGFVMGISGSWMLFTGLLGAWLAAVFLIPAVKGNKAFASFYTFPEIFNHFYNYKVAFLAGIISAIGYTGFTSSQILAGAKLASGTFEGLSMNTALVVMGAIVVGYTVMGGIKAVIYTDTIQFVVLMSGLAFVGLPVSYYAVGGWEAIYNTLPAEFFSLTNLTWQNVVNWAITIMPIWFVGMTLYQRIFASRDVKSAQKSWYIAGLLEWPVLAIMGVLLGLIARVAAEQGMFGYLGVVNVSDLDPEVGLPMLLRTVIPVGLMGLVMSAYFSAILSTADSCLMAASANVVADLLGKIFKWENRDPSFLRTSQIITLLIGILALFLATQMTNVLDLMLYSYAFMVSGLFVPIIGALFWSKSSAIGAFWAMLSGGIVTVYLTSLNISLPLGLDPNIYGISISLILFIMLSYLYPNKRKLKQA